MLSSNLKQRGFTLLEIIIALAILATISVSVTQIFALGVDTTLKVENESYAFTLAESKMDELLLLPDVNNAAKSGDFEDTQYRYRLTITPQAYPGKPRNHELIHIKLAVLWGNEESPNSIQLESLKIQEKPKE